MSMHIGPSLVGASLGDHLSHDNAAIDEGMEESGQKHDAAMTTAWTGMAIGIAQGLHSIGATAAGHAQQGLTTSPVSRLPGLVPMEGLHSAVRSQTAERMSEKLIENKLDSLSEMGEMESLRLQKGMDALSKMMSTLSNLLQKVSQTQDAITDNLK